MSMPGQATATKKAVILRLIIVKHSLFYHFYKLGLPMVYLMNKWL